MIDTSKLKKVVTWKVDGKTYGSFIAPNEQSTRAVWYTTSNGQEAVIDFTKFTPEISFTYKTPSGAFALESTGDITVIKDGAFENVDNIKAVRLPNRVESIEAGAFTGSSIETLENVGMYAVLEEGVFAGANYLTSVQIHENSPYSVDSSCVIDDSSNGVLISALADATGVPSGIERIGERAFYMSNSLSTMTLPNTVTNIGTEAFAESSLTKLTLSITDPTDLTLDEGAFDGEFDIMVGFTVVDAFKAAWPAYADRIKSQAPANNQILYTTTDGNVLTPGTGGKWNASGTSAVITSNVYEGGVGLITFDKAIDQIPFQAFIGKTTLSAILLPESITVFAASYGYGCFQNCSALTSANIPSGVTSLGFGCFKGCSALTSANIPSGVTSLDNSCFKGCSALTSANIPSGVTIVYGECFSGCTSLTSVDMPSSVTTLSGESFFLGCTSLTSVTVRNTTPPTLGNYAFVSTPATMKIYVPAASVDTYKAASGWSGYASKIEAIPSPAYHVYYTTNDQQIIENFMYSDDVTVESNTYDTDLDRGDIKFTGDTFSWINMSQNVTLTSVELPEGLVALKEVSGGEEISSDYAYGCFEECENLSSVSLPTTLNDLGKKAFLDCYALTQITIPDNVTEIPDYCFYGAAISAFTLSDNITSIGEGAFGYNSTLTHFEFPSQVTYIPRSCFEEAEGLVSVVIPENVTSMGEYAFNTTPLLETVTIYAVTPPEIETYTFDSNFQYMALRKIYVPAASVDAYKAATNWSNYASFIDAITEA